MWPCITRQSDLRLTACFISAGFSKSKWDKHELEGALVLEISRDRTVLFPVRVDEAVMLSEAGCLSVFIRFSAVIVRSEATWQSI
jgi:hypothetical protein